MLVKSDWLWRLTEAHDSGLDQVSMVLPCAGEVEEEIQLETDVHLLTGRHHPSPLDLEWTPEDLSLFVVLVEKVLDIDMSEPKVSLNLDDDSLVGVVHIVAAARFATPLPSDELLSTPIATPSQEFDIGDWVAINTLIGFKVAIIVEMDSIDAKCVLLDEVLIEDPDVCLEAYDVLMVNKHDLLIPEFGDVMPGAEATIH
jgi:hypothetical protein